MGKLNRKKTFVAVGMIGCAIMALMLVMFGTPQASGESGGTDGEIETFGEPGGGGDIPWNEVHGFVITEDGTKVEDPFNVTLCENVKEDKDNGGYKPSGYIFGELNEIQWADDNPEPSLLIKEEDFDEYKEDEWTMECYVFAEYVREADSPGEEDEVRQAYKDVTVTRPNHAPSPVIMITNSDEYDNGDWSNWSLVDVTGTELIYYINSEGIDVKFHLNASESADEDGDNITEFRWDLDEDGTFGGESRERKMNTTLFLGEGDHTIALIVGDGDKYSEPLDLIVTIRQPIRYPDLELSNLNVVNKNGLDDIIQGDGCNLYAIVKNTGEEDQVDPFDILYEYWFMDESAEPYWREITTITYERGINVNELKIIEAFLDTGDSRYVPGTYGFRSTIDPANTIDELRELNNQFEILNITILEDCTGCGGDTEFEFISVTTDMTRLLVNELATITVTIKNIGEYQAKYVDIQYIVDGSDVVLSYIDFIDPEEESSLMFSLSPNTAKIYEITFEIIDNGIVRGTSEPIYIEGYTNSTPPPPPPPPNGTNESGIPIELIIGGALLVIVPVTVGTIFWTNKRKEDDVW